MNNLVSFILFGLALALAAWTFLVWRGFSQDWLPDELKAGRVAQVERNLRADHPYRVIGRPDQVYRLPDGLHVPLENKNRDAHRVYETDIAQLSLQGWLLRRNGLPTAAFGYAVINSRTTRKRRAIRVELRDDAYCEQLIARYLAIIEGRAQARKSRGPKCKSCGHAGACN
jgi:CRISPR-associated exonuclease Cas4